MKRFRFKSEWAQATLIGLTSGGVSSSAVLLVRFGFDKNAVFAFIGSIIASASIVLFCIGQEERKRAFNKEQELQEIEGYFQPSVRR